MRRVPRVLALVVVGLLCTGCMDTRTASLGIEVQRVPAVVSDAASAPGARDAGPSVGDASTVPPDVDADDSGDADDSADDDDADDAGLHSEHVDAAQSAADAGRLPPSIDAASAAPADAGAADTAVAQPDDARDAAREDAKVPVNPLCIAEPWHCQ